MTKVFDELLDDADVVYIGEDVEHGGYYLVTEGLVARHGQAKVRNFPPDETALVGVGMGLSQAGMTPIVEIPYAKYLDCAADIFAEVVIMNWLTNGTQRAGMLVRLQGFDRGLFGGNFHTHNMITILPGLDVVCYSNGYDYVRGIRYAMRQVRQGRVVMSVDSTHLLNKRHLREGGDDKLLLHMYPSVGFEMPFDEVVFYKLQNGLVTRSSPGDDPLKVDILIVSYGNGVVSSLIAMEELNKEGVSAIVIDCPYLSKPPKQLREHVQGGGFQNIIFADVCKEGAGMPLGGIANSLQNEGLLDSMYWRVIGAAPTYNPLGNMVTFLDTQNILQECRLAMFKSGAQATRL